MQVIRRAPQGEDWSWCQCIKHRHLQERVYICCIHNINILLNYRQHQKCFTWVKEKINWTIVQGPKVLFLGESEFCISFGNQGPRVWRKSREAQNKVLVVQCEVSTVCDDLGWHVICWCWSTMFHHHQSQHRLPRDIRALHAFICWQGLWRCRVPFRAGLSTCPQYLNYYQIFADHIITVLDWPDNSHDLNPIENL